MTCHCEDDPFLEAFSIAVRYNVRMAATVLTDDQVLALIAHLPECCPADPWTKSRAPVSDEELVLFALGFVDAKGNLTLHGLYEWEKIEADMQHYSDMLFDLADMEELDRLDRACRKRPRYRRYDG